MPSKARNTRMLETGVITPWVLIWLSRKINKNPSIVDGESSRPSDRLRGKLVRVEFSGGKPVVITVNVTTEVTTSQLPHSSHVISFVHHSQSLKRIAQQISIMQHRTLIYTPMYKRSARKLGRPLRRILSATGSTSYSTL